MLGLTYFNLKQYENAFPSLQQAIRLDPTFAESHYWIGRVYVEGFKQNEKGVAAFQEALRIKPNDAPSHRDLAMTYLRMGRKNDALTVYKKLLPLNKQMAQKVYAEINKSQ